MVKYIKDFIVLSETDYKNMNIDNPIFVCSSRYDAENKIKNYKKNYSNIKLDLHEEPLIRETSISVSFD